GRRRPGRDREQPVVLAKGPRSERRSAPLGAADLFGLGPVGVAGYRGFLASPSKELPIGMSTIRSAAASRASAALSAALIGARGIEISSCDSWCPDTRWRSRTPATSGRMVALV